MEGERVAPTMRLQDKCHVHLREESINTYGNSHGFEVNRTVWYGGKLRRGDGATGGRGENYANLGNNILD